MHTPAPGREYCPGGHFTAVELREPLGHMYPAVHKPLQFAVVSPDVLPK